MEVIDGDDLSLLRRGTIDFCVLSVLQHEDDYGLSLLEKLRAYPGLQVTEGSLYPVLTRLRTAGSVDVRWAPSAGGPPRRYYTLTSRGAERLEDFRRAWEVYSRSVELALEKTS